MHLYSGQIAIKRQVIRMKIFVAGLTGATGRLLASQLLASGHTVFGFVRTIEALPVSILSHRNIRIQQGSLLEVSDSELSSVLDEVDGMACCLGHNLTLQGIWGQPRTLVRDAVQRLVELTQHKPIRLVLMSSNGVVNARNNEQLKGVDRVVISVLRKILPPQRDNELAAVFLQNQTYPNLKWSIVRPDNLVDHDEVTDYKVFSSPQLGVIIDTGQTSRINVAHFMSTLLTDDIVWSNWQNQWPVLYNATALNKKCGSA